MRPRRVKILLVLLLLLFGLVVSLSTALAQGPDDPRCDPKKTVVPASALPYGFCDPLPEQKPNVEVNIENVNVDIETVNIMGDVEVHEQNSENAAPVTNPAAEQKENSIFGRVAIWIARLGITGAIFATFAAFGLFVLVITIRGRYKARIDNTVSTYEERGRQYFSEKEE